MAKVKSGIAFHCHHDCLYEAVYDFDNRIEYIKGSKPAHEQALRLKLFKLIPEDKLPGKNSKTWEAYSKAWEASLKTWEAYSKAKEAYHKAYEAEIKTLHTELCPDCPWDGKTIFPQGVK